MSHLYFIIFGLLLTLVPSAYGAAIQPPVTAQLCAQCHGTQGEGRGIYPRIAGQPKTYLQDQIMRIRDGQRANPEMQRMIRSLSDQDAQELATYFSALSPPYSYTPNPLGANQRGLELLVEGNWKQAVPACTRCHGSDLASGQEHIPALAGQTPQYLASRLQAFAQNKGSSTSESIMHHVSRKLSEGERKAVVDFVQSLAPGAVLQLNRPASTHPNRPHPQSPDKFVPPPESTIPKGAEGDMIWQGRQLFDQTQKYAPQYARASLSCANCHINHGRMADSSPMWAAYVAYPKYREKNKKVNSLEDRIQDCFRYSMNGKAPPADSAQVRSLIAYFYWLATGLPVGIVPKGQGYPRLKTPPQEPSINRGRAVYQAKCALCHAKDGSGYARVGTQTFPPLWGVNSFNWGSGMQRISLAAGFIKANMPYGAPNTLSEQEAWDVAAFVMSRERPQDPRFTGDVQDTRKKYHESDSFYGQFIEGRVLGAPIPASTHKR